MAPWGTPLAVMADGKIWAPASKKPGKSVAHLAIPFLMNAGQLPNSAWLRAVLRKTKAALLLRPAPWLAAIYSLSAKAKMDENQMWRIIAGGILIGIWPTLRAGLKSFYKSWCEGWRKGRDRRSDSL